MLSTQQISDLIADPDKPGRNGSVEALRRAGMGRDGSSTLTGNQRRLLEQIRDLPKRPVRATYRHPDHGAYAPPRSEPLSATQIAWLTRLPTDPSEVSFADAHEVLRLRHSAVGTVHANDRKLLDSIAVPIMEFHDHNKAVVDLQNAVRPLATQPDAALSAMADAIANENQHLTDDEAIGRASQMLSEIQQERIQARDDAIATAEARLVDLQSSTADRLAVTR
jgi:hypothetical protein